MPRMGSQITANIDVVKEFIYLGTAINTKSASGTAAYASRDENFLNLFISIVKTQSSSYKVLLHNISESAFALYDDNRCGACKPEQTKIDL